MPPWQLAAPTPSSRPRIFAPPWGHMVASPFQEKKNDPRWADDRNSTQILTTTGNQQLYQIPRRGIRKMPLVLQKEEETATTTTRGRTNSLQLRQKVEARETQLVEGTVRGIQVA